MSKEAVEKMMQAADRDTALRQALESAQGFAEVVEIGAQNDCQFTEEEVQAVLKERGIFQENTAAEGELSDEALEAVAGGYFENLRITFGDGDPITIRKW